MRGLDPQRSVLFFVLVLIEEDEPGLYGAIIPGLENRLSAIGTSAREAESHAMELFRDLVDAAVEDGTPLSNVLPTTVPFKSIDEGIDQADAVFEHIEQFIEDSASIVAGEWRESPTSPSIPIFSETALHA